VLLGVADRLREYETQALRDDRLHRASDATSGAAAEAFRIAAAETEH
jgi:hypothetical protein